MKKALIILVVVLAVAGFGIYKLVNSLGRAGDAGDAAVSVFHGHYNADQVDRITAEAAPAFRSTISADQFSGIIRLLREKLGDWKSGKQSGVNLNTKNGDTTLEITYDSTFTKAAGTEEFVFDYNGDVPLLLGYHVKSPALLEIPEEKPADKTAEKPEESAKP